MILSKTDLARRIGVAPAAISKALRAGRLVANAENKIDLSNPINQRYAGALNPQRRQRGESEERDSGVGKGASPARMAKHRAQYAHLRHRLEQGKAAVVPRYLVEFRLGLLLDIFKAEVEKLPEAVDLAAPELERHLEALVSGAIKNALAAAMEAPLPDEGVAHDEGHGLATLPPEAPLSWRLDTLKDGILASEAQIIRAGLALRQRVFVRKEDVKQRVASLDGGLFQRFRSLPRRVVGNLEALRASGDEKGAREYLAASIKEDFHYESFAAA